MRNASAHALPTPHGDSSSAIPPWCLALPFCDAHTVIRNKVMIFCGKGKILRAFTKKKKERQHKDLHGMILNRISLHMHADQIQMKIQHKSRKMCMCTTTNTDVQVNKGKT